METLAPGNVGHAPLGNPFPILWAMVIATVREDGHHLRLLTVLVFVVVGGVIWAVGMTVGAIIWGIAVRLGH